MAIRRANSGLLCFSHRTIAGAAAGDSACAPVRRFHRWLGMMCRCTAVALAMSAGVPCAAMAQAPDSTSSRPLPLGAEWARRRGIDLPNPFGVGLFVVTMSRDIEVMDVRVTGPGGESVSVSDVGTFAVRNQTTLSALKFDAWVGAAWLATERTLPIIKDSPALGAVLVEVDQQPVDPLTYQVGGSVSVGERWDVLVEVGSNFKDAFVGVFSATFRF